MRSDAYGDWRIQSEEEQDVVVDAKSVNGFHCGGNASLPLMFNIVSTSLRPYPKKKPLRV